MIILTFIGRYPYDGWGVIQILRGIAMLLLVSSPRIVLYAILHRSHYNPSKSEFCGIARAITMVIQAILYLLMFIQLLADPNYESFGLGKAANAIFEILMIIIVTFLNGYLIFLFFYFGKKGMGEHEEYKKKIALRKEIRKRQKEGLPFDDLVGDAGAQGAERIPGVAGQGGDLGVIPNQLPGYAAGVDPIEARIQAQKAQDMEQQNMQDAIAASMK
jgi:hypothetical protein